MDIKHHAGQLEHILKPTGPVTAAAYPHTVQDQAEVLARFAYQRDAKLFMMLPKIVDALETSHEYISKRVAHTGGHGETIVLPEIVSVLNQLNDINCK